MGTHFLLSVKASLNVCSKWHGVHFEPFRKNLERKSISFRRKMQLLEKA